MLLGRGISFRIFWAVMALYMLNICVDSPDLLPNLPENLNFNDQESIIELVVEKFLGFENAIPEQDDCDIEDHDSSKTPRPIDHFMIDALKFAFQTDFSSLTKEPIPWKWGCSPANYLEVDAPPPQV